MLSNGENRTVISRTLNVDIHLIDDILSGKTYRYISKKYIDKGFSYREKRYYNRSEREIGVHKACKLIEEDNGLTTKEIAKIAGHGLSYRDISNIRRGNTYRYISNNYNIDYNKYRKNE